MPIYEYRCPKCGNTFEILRSMVDADKALKCPNCESEKAERLLSLFSGGGGCGGGSASGPFT